MKTSKGWLSKAAFKRIFRFVPRPTVELVIVDGEDLSRFLLGRRTRRPYRNQWFVIGGGILYGENLGTAVWRVLAREIGIANAQFKFIGHSSYVFPPNDFGVRTHGLLHVYLVEIPRGTHLTPNQDNTALRWFRAVDPRWPRPTRMILAHAGFRAKGV